MTRIVLTGFMGTGKTTVGRLLAEQYGLAFTDTDEEIERYTGRGVPEIIRRDGEQAFRRVEREVLGLVLDNRGSFVVATGGGTLLTEESRALVQDATVICLTAEPAVLAARVARGDRPLLSDDGALNRLFADRRPIYARFPQVDTTAVTPDEAAAQVAALAGLPLAEIAFDRPKGSTVLFGALEDQQLVAAGTVLIVTDETVASCGHTEKVRASFDAGGAQVAMEIIPAGEDQKSMDRLAALYGVAVHAGVQRGDVIAGVGGGVVCDLAGYLAATYMRGTRLVLCPTTLLAQVDAAIGGKVGIDFGGVKNLLGAFYPAERIVIDPSVLRTLPIHRLSEGLAEVLKIALMKSRALLEVLRSLERPDDVLDRPDIIRLAVSLKASVVRRDPYERGERMHLNFGHTIGHGIEAASGYRLAHGDAVSIGMIAEARLGVEMGAVDARVLAILEDMLPRLGLPARATGLDSRQVLQFMEHDKKRSGARLRLAVPAKPGEGTILELEPKTIVPAVQSATGVNG